MGKDPLCPLGFHPQVRWPTRCKRCFRDYKEHNLSKKDESGNSNLRKDEVTGSAPSLTASQSESYGRFRQSHSASPAPASLTQTYNARRNTTGNLYLDEQPTEEENISEPSKAAEPERSEKEKDYSSIYSSLSGSALSRLSKLRPGLGKEDHTPTGSPERRRATALDHINERFGDRSSDDGDKRGKRIQIQGLKEVRSFDTDSTNPDVEFIFEVKKSSARTAARSSYEDDERSSLAGTEMTETTETTLVEGQVEDLNEQIASLRKDLEAYKTKCDRLEREKGDLLLKKIATYDTRSRNSELAKLQQRIRELETTQDDLIDDKKSAELRVKELEQELERKTQSQDPSKTIDDLRSRLMSAENVIEELMEENEELKKEMRQMVEEMDEMQDNFREDQADEYRDIKKELEQTAKNCRIIQFKLRKAERRIEQVEAEKIDVENRLQQLQTCAPASVSAAAVSSPGAKVASGNDANKDRVHVLEHELAIAKELSLQMQKELQTLREQVHSSDVNKKEHNLKGGPVLSKSRSLEGTSVRHGEDTTQLIRDLQDSKEREADLREQLKFSEEEAQALRKKLSRVEEENETLVMQLKKMATKKGRRTTPDTSIDKDEGISDDMDDLSLSELKLQLELNEQETSVLRRKVEDMESENERLHREVTELQEKTKSIQNAKPQVVITPPGENAAPNAYYDQKIRTLEQESKDLRLKLIEKDREVERLEGELTLVQKNKGKVIVQRSRSLDNSESNVDLNRKLTLIEQEAAILRTKISDLESENEKLTSENRRMHLRVSRKPPPTPQEQLILDKAALEDQVQSLEKRLSEANAKVTDLTTKLTANSPRLGRSTEKGKNLSPNSSSELNVLKREKELVERELKSKEDELATMKSQLLTAENSKSDLENQLQKIRNDLATPTKPRTPKVPSESMTKLQLKKMVEDLEREISDFCLKPCSNIELELKELRETLRNEQEQCKTLQGEKSALETKIQQIQRDVKSILPKSSAQTEQLQKQLNDASKKCADLEVKLRTAVSGEDVEAVQKIKQEKHRLQKELAEKESKVTELERKMKDCEDKIKKSERSLKDQKDQLNAIQKELEDETAKVKRAEAQQEEMSVAWNKERDELKKQASDLKSKLEELETAVTQKDKKLKDMDLFAKEEAKKAMDAAGRKAEKEIKAAQEEVGSLKSKLEEAELKLKQNEQERKLLNEKCSKLETDWRREKDQWQSKNTDLELEVKAEKKKRERIEKEHDKDLQEKDEEMILMRERVKRAEQESKNIQEKLERLKNQDTRVAELELALEQERQEYEDLTAKYELLEEDYVVIKARLVMDKEQIEEDHSKLVKDHETLEGELRTLRETFNHRQDTWIKEKLDMQEKVKELEEKLNRSSSENWQGERNRLKTQLEEKSQLLEKAKREEETLQDQLSNLRKENDEIKRKLDDFDKVTKVQRSMTVDTSAHDKEIRELKNKLTQEEKAHRSEMSQVKLRHDNRLALLNEEMHTYQTQLEKARRERDTFREMLEGAQKMIGELKRDPAHQRTLSDSDSARTKEMEDNMEKIEEFHSKITDLEDELTEARMEISRLKTEAINEKSAWEIRVSEMQTRINEMEEDKVMTTGRSRIPGTKTRLELAWQKERDEMQRLLQETSTLARDLRQTLFDVEKERDRERLDAKRKLEQAKKGLEEDQEEMRRKVQELQCDLLELRDAHAKLRTTCEKLRRDKDRSEKEREDMRLQMQDLRRTETDEERKVIRLLDDVQKMKDLCPLVMGTYLTGTRSEPKPVRESPGEKVRDEFLEALKNISRTTEELKRVHRLDEPDVNKRSMSFRRAMSSAPDDTNNSHSTSSKRNSLYRRTQSLEQSQALDEIEKEERGSISSVHSIGVSTPQSYSKVSSNVRYSTLPTRARTVERDQSVDRMSTTSTKSEMIPPTPETKKKKSLIGKIKLLSKSRSIEETNTADSIVTAGIKALMPGVGDHGSDLSLESRESRTDEKKEKDKKKMKDKISGFFKKGSSSRTNSMERSDSFESYAPGDESRDRRSASTQRPLMRQDSNGSTSSVAATTAPSPAPSMRTVPDPRSSAHASATPTKQIPANEPQPTPGYAPSMSPLGYSALLSNTSTLPRRSRAVTNRSKTTDLRPVLHPQGSQETNV